MRVLIACEFSGVVRDAFRDQGHEAWSCDLESVEPEGRWPNYHLCGDVRWFLPHGTPSPRWDLMIAHPPCTFLANSGARWLYNGGKGTERNPDRWRNMKAAADFFNDLAGADIPKIAIENPIMHKYGREIVGRKYDQIIQPWQFGHGETKATCLWLKGLPALIPTDIVDGRAARVHLASPGKDRWKERSRTLPGVAAAMVTQWA